MEFRQKAFEVQLIIWIRRKRILASFGDIGAGLRSKMKFKSKDLDSNEFLI
jgi:hypothetical protein